MGRFARLILSDPAPRRAVRANGPRAILTRSAHVAATPPSVAPTCEAVDQPDWSAVSFSRPWALGLGPWGLTAHPARSQVLP